MKEMRSIAPFSQTDRIPHRCHAAAQAIAALFGLFIYAGFVVVEKVLGPELGQRHDGHEDIGPGLEAQFPAQGMESLQGRRRRDIDIPQEKARHGDHGKAQMETVQSILL